MEIGWRKYRPKPKTVSDFLIRRFCMKCLRVWGLGRGFKMLRNRCGGCPVLEALSTVNPRLKRMKAELKQLEEMREAIRNV